MGKPAQPGSPGIHLRLQPRRARISIPLPLREQTLPGPAPTWPAVAVLRAKEEKGGKENQESSSHSSFPNPLQAQLFSPGAESLHSAQAPAGFSDRIPPADSQSLSTPERAPPTKSYHSHRNKPFSFHPGLEFKRRGASRMQTFLASLPSDVASSKNMTSRRIPSQHGAS